MSRLRATIVLTGFLLMTLPLMPVQWALLRIGSKPAQRRFPHWYHRQVCRLIGVRVHQHGSVAGGAGGVLLISNHVSWLDIPVMSALAPLSFIAKREVGEWPFVGWLAKLQRSVFVDRDKRSSVDEQMSAIRQRLADGDTVVLFAEGTTGDGNRTLPFKSSLFGAIGFKSNRLAVAAGKPVAPPAAERLAIAVQSMTIAYTRLHGMPIARAERPLIAWYGDMDAASHAWQLLGLGPIDAEIRISDPVPLDDYADRKALARATESEIIRQFRALNRPSPAAATPSRMDAGARSS